MSGATICEELFRLMVETAEDYAIFMLSSDGTVIDWNIGAERLNGYRADEIVGQHVSRFYVEEDVRAGKPQRDFAIAEEKGRFEDQGWRLRKGGSRFWANVVVTALRDGRGHLRGFGNVVAERKLVDRKLLENVSRQAQLLQLSDDAIIQRLPAGRIETWNRGAERLYGFTAEEACGRVSHELLQTRFPQTLTEIEAQVRADAKGRWEGELVHKTKAGQTVVVSAKFQLIEDDDGVEHVLETNRDVTENKRLAAEALQHDLERLALKEAARRKDEFLAMLGHELRNPLSPIVAALQILKQQGNSQPAKTRAIEVLERQVRHMIRLVDDLLDVSRILSGRIPIRKRLLRLQDVVAQGVEMAMPLIEERRHRLDVHFPSSELHVIGDEDRIAQIIANLLTNSAKYTDPGGHITVEARREGDAIVLAVKDTGIGITPDLLPRVFDLFSQERQSADRARGGLGLGLALVRRLVELYGGTVQAESEGPGKGSVFTVRLPAATEVPVAKDCPPTAVSVVAKHPRRILVVDDNEDALDLLADILRSSGHVVMTAKDGPSALVAVKSFHADVAILDIGLPVMDGYELAYRLRAELGKAAPRLIALTGYGQDSDRAHAKEVGFAQHLTKPANIPGLLSALDASPHA